MVSCPCPYDSFGSEGIFRFKDSFSKLIVLGPYVNACGCLVAMIFGGGGYTSNTSAFIYIYIYIIQIILHSMKM